MQIKQKEMAKKLSAYAGVYVNDAFGTAHRAHATTAVMADFFDTEHKMFGYLINSELAAMGPSSRKVVVEASLRPRIYP